MNRTPIKDDLKIKGKATGKRTPSSAMTGIKKVGDKSKNKASSWVLAKSNKKLVYDVDKNVIPTKKEFGIPCVRTMV